MTLMIDLFAACLGANDRMTSMIDPFAPTLMIDPFAPTLMIDPFAPILNGRDDRLGKPWQPMGCLERHRARAGASECQGDNGPPVIISWNEYGLRHRHGGGSVDAQKLSRAKWLNEAGCCERRRREGRSWMS